MDELVKRLRTTGFRLNLEAANAIEALNSAVNVMKEDRHRMYMLAIEWRQRFYAAKGEVESIKFHCDNVIASVEADK